MTNAIGKKKIPEWHFSDAAVVNIEKDVNIVHIIMRNGDKNDY